MRTLKWLFVLCSMLLITACGGDKDINENAGDPRDTPGQNDNSNTDTDNDGVYDSDDQCPDTPNGESVDASGCSDSQKDSDGDGVNDNDDQCPDTSADATVDENGCAEDQKDSDGDGVTDDIDQCADTPAGEEVDEYGCSGSQTDGDGDGVANEDDACPNTPEGESVDENGCSDSQKDTDGDGVNDDEDECPDTPEGESADEQGCSNSQKDSDGDGVTDDADACPDTPEGEEVNEEGCSETQKDSDGDGVNDDQDECPDTPEGEEVDEQGCSDSQKDSDGDGVNDDADTCPDTPEGEQVDENGCSAAQSDTTPPQVTSITITEIAETYFKVDWRINEGSKGYIRFGTSSGSYQDSTAIEHRYLDRHRQTVGGENPAPLTPGTTYYWQIYTEDEQGNSGYWEEQTTTTSQEQQKTFIPDDAFEQYLIDNGYDDVLDDYVITERIKPLTELDMGNQGPSNYRIIDWTGIQDFHNLETIFIETPNIALDKMETAPALRQLIIWGTDIVSLTIRNFPQLEEFAFLSFSDYANRTNTIDISDNPKMKTIKIAHMSYIEDRSIRIENNPALETAEVIGTSTDNFDVINNSELHELIIGGPQFYEPCQTNKLSLQNNSNLRELNIRHLFTEEMDIVNSTNISVLYGGGDSADSGINRIDFTQVPNIEELYLEDIISLDISQIKALKILEIFDEYEDRLTKLDVSNNYDLTILKINRHNLNCIKVNQAQLDNIPTTWEVSPPVPYTLDCE
ncbi:thrombospondin type 3 repeat-containing protein [Robertkochia sediminum]|uniref:thrombospondin type 3 repeat-containing protein n=1 Tax=Robertkochia sediminum TaxID=2785326 RepID=UPI001934B658|nr:thrombospondin type 3 repeat-containing protein [Robertkochia sediminum]MBL7473732.1 thrombospondin type 3 repeat-containing protein [Robertkochia sediminum]